MARVAEVVGGAALIVGGAIAMYYGQPYGGMMISAGVSMVIGGSVALYNQANPIGVLNGQLQITQNISNWRVLYGTFQTAGIVTFTDFPRPYSDANHQYIHVVQTLTAHEISQFVAVSIDGDIYMIGAAPSFLVFDFASGYYVPRARESYDSDADWAIYGKYYDHLAFEFDRGETNNISQPFPNLAAEDTKWTGACLQRECAKVHIRMRYDKSLVNSPPSSGPLSGWAPFSGSQIPRFQFLVVGKPIKDTRTTSSDMPGWLPRTGFKQNSWVLDGGGNVEVQVNGPLPAAITGDTLPAFAAVGAVAPDASAAWRNSGPIQSTGWTPATLLAWPYVFVDPNGNLQSLNSGPFTTGAAAPAWNKHIGDVTMDANARAWTCLGPSIFYSVAANPSNTALCIYDYMTTPKSSWGMGVDPADISVDALNAAANICDESMMLQGSRGENRYTTNGMFDTSSPRGKVLSSMLAAMAGWALSPGNAWQIFAGAYIAPTLELGDGDMRDAIKGDFRVSRRDLANGVRGTFVPSYLPPNAANPRLVSQWQWTDYPPYQSAAYITEDGGEVIWGPDIHMDFTTSLWGCQRLAKISLEKLRRQGTYTLPCKLSAYQLQAGDNFYFTHARWNYARKVLQVIQLTLVHVQDKSGNPIVAVDLLCRETDPTIYDFRAPNMVDDFDGEYSEYGRDGEQLGNVQ